MEDYLNFSCTFEDLPEMACSLEDQWVLQKENHYRLGIGLSRRCNLKCLHCYYHTAKVPVVDMNLSLLKAILEKMPRMASINFGLEGEPFLYPYFFEVLDYSTCKTDAIMITSNGNLLNNNTLNRLKQYPIANLLLSIEGATKESYERWREYGSFRNFCLNAASAVDKFGSALSLHATVFQQNMADLLKLPELAAQLGITNISFQQLRPLPAIARRGIWPARQKELLLFLEKIIEAADKNRVVLNFDTFFATASVMNFLKNFSVVYNINILQESNEACAVVYHCTSILADGRLFPCCGDFHPVKITQYTFDGIYNHPILLKLRKMTVNGLILQSCKYCHYKL